MLPSRHTAHSHFKTPIKLDNVSSCNVKQSTPPTKLLCIMSLIIWVKKLIMREFVFEALDRKLQDFMHVHDYNVEQEVFVEK